MKCGKGHDHQTVADVRQCYGAASASQGPAAPSAPLAGDQWNHRGAPTVPAPAPGITPRQQGFVASLLHRRGLALLGREVSSLTKAQASGLIDRLLDKEPLGADEMVRFGLERARLVPGEAAAPAVAGRPRRPFPEVPAGRYAIVSGTGHNDLDFFRVWVAESGFRRVFRVIGGRADQLLAYGQALEAAERIYGLGDAGMASAKARYGQEIGDCGECGRHLTDEESRRLGIGPVCRSK